MSKPLGAGHTCRHLASAQGERPGRFYPRCELGGQRERLLWLAALGPARLDIASALVAEFAEHSHALRDALVKAKAELKPALGYQSGHAGLSPVAADARRRLDALVDEFAQASHAFLLSNSPRLVDVGLPVQPLMTLIEVSLRAWAAAPEGPPSIDPAGLADFSPAVRELLAPTLGAARRSVAENDGQVLVESPTLRILRTSDPAGLRISGEIDVTNVHHLSNALVDAISRGGCVNVNLGELLFCDISGLRELVEAAQNISPGGRLVISDLPRHLATALRAVGWGGMLDGLTESTAEGSG